MLHLIARVATYLSSLITLWTRYIKFLSNSKNRADLTKSESKLIIPESIKTRLQALGKNNLATMKDIVKFAYAQPHFLTSAWISERFENPLNYALSLMHKYKCNWFHKKILRNCPMPEIPADATEYNYCGCAMPFSVAALLGSKKIIVLHAEMPLKNHKNVLVVYGSGNEYGFQAMFGDENGLQFGESEVKYMDDYARNAGGYPCIRNNQFRRAEAWASLMKNANFFHNKPLLFLFLSAPIVKDKKTKNWIKKYGSKYDNCMYNI